MTSESSVCNWKRLWRLASGFSSSTCHTAVSEQLGEVKDQLEKGLLYFSPATTESFTKLSSKYEKHPEALAFIKKLQQFIGLDSFQTWDVFHHYVLDSFHGTLEMVLGNFSLMDLIPQENLIRAWKFFNSERSFMLKLIRLILEHRHDPTHPYYKEFDGVVEKITISKLKESVISQFKHVVEEIPPTKTTNGDSMTFDVQKMWMKRNLNEQLELLTAILVLMEDSALSVQEFKKLFSVFKSHNFGRQPIYYKYLDETHNSSVSKIVYVEIAIFYKIITDAGRDNISAIIPCIKDDIESELIRLQHNEEHGALLLAWMLILLETSISEEVFISRYQHFGTKALQLRVFEFLYNMCTHSMFDRHSKCGSIFRNSLYHLLCNMCNKFDGDGSMSTHPYAVELCGELLTSPYIAKKFWEDSSKSENQGIVSIWNTAMEFFPYDFKSLSVLITGLVQASPSSCNNVINEIKNLPMFTEVYRPRITPVSNLNDEINVVLTADFSPYGNRDVMIKASSEAAILDRRNATLIHYRTDVSYWKILCNEIYSLIENSFQHDISDKIERIVYGIKALNAVLDTNNGDDIGSLSKPCEAVFELLVKFSHSSTPYVPLISACFKLCTYLIPRFHKETFSRLMNIGLLPHIDNRSLTEEQYANGDTFSTSLIGHFLVNVEQVHGEYPVFMSYLDMAVQFFTCDYDDDIRYGILFPALVFVLREVFPHMSGWHFRTIDEKQKLYSKCMSYLFNMLSLSPEQTKNSTDRLLNRTCLYSLLSLDDGMALLKIVSFGEQNIQCLVEEETNLKDGPGVKCIKLVQMAMAILMQILRLKHLIKDKGVLSPLEHLIYTQSKQKNTMKIVPLVTEYLNHVFNKNLPNIACSLLKRFSMESHMSLLVCLDMTPHQIRTMFLERLRDKTESDVLKTTILEFVATCVEKQPGLTEVFFKVSHIQKDSIAFPSEAKTEKTDGILSFMAEYLSVVKDDISTLYSPLLNRIMDLFHALWKNNMQILVKDLRQNPNFWEYLCSPLFQDILPDMKAYSQIFNMIGIELFLLDGKIDKSLQNSLEKFVNDDNKYIKKWIAHIFAVDRDRSRKESADETPVWLSLLTSWKNFVSIFIKYQAVTINADVKYTMSDSCLNALNRELEDSPDNRVLIILAETYAIYFSNWKLDCIDDWQEFFYQISLLLINTASSFDSLHHRAKYAILAISTLSLNMSSYDLKVEKELSHKIFHSVCLINNFQLDKLSSTSDDGENYESEHSETIMIALKLLEQAIYILERDFIDLDHSFPITSLVNKLMMCTIDHIHRPDKLNQTLASLSCLTAYARRSTSKALLHCNVSQNMWLKLLPPKDLLTPVSEGASWQASSWWKVYECGIEFVTAMLETHQHFFAPEAILFAGVQEDYLIESILLLRQTLDTEALNLAQSALYFLTELIKYQNLWKQEHQQSLINLMRSVCMCLHYCITLILRPKSISLLVETPLQSLPTEESESAGPSPKVIAVSNKLLDLMYLSSVSLKAFSPNLLDLLTNPCIETNQWQPLMELQFGSPKLSPDPFPALTFGTVMSAVCYLTRSLNHNFHAEDTPLNVIKKFGRKGSSRRKFISSLGNEDGIRRRAFRSDSVTSVSSTTSTAVITSNTLAALDKKLVFVTLENILTLLASQTLLAVKDPKMPSKDKQVIRRELCAELPMFHDFVKKKIIDLSHPKNHLCRRKHGIYQLVSGEEETKNPDAERCAEEEPTESDDGLFTPPPLPRKRVSDSMRISVVRKLHLDKTKTATKDAPTGMKETQDSSTPGTSKSADCSADSSQKHGGRSTKHVTWDESLSPQDEEDQTVAEDLECNFLSEVQMVEEDYLHFLSNVFLYICQTDH